MLTQIFHGLIPLPPKHIGLMLETIERAKSETSAYHFWTPVLCLRHFGLILAVALGVEVAGGRTVVCDLQELRLDALVHSGLEHYD